jgi:hypothetical protein
MLSFMREQQVSDLTGQAPAPGGDDNNPRDEEYLAVSSGGQNVRKTTSVLIVLFVVGLVGLLFMIKKSSPRTAGAAGTAENETRITAAIGRLTGIKAEMFNRMDEIVEKFYEFSDVEQVEVSKLAKNPFRHELLWTNMEGLGDEDEELLRQQQLQKQAQMLQLLSIIQSEQGNCCMIDDKILREGDSIKGFRVGQIGENFVKLESDQNQSQKLEIVLKLSE